VDVLAHLDTYVLFVIGIVTAPVSAYAFAHALRQRSDAFPAVGKLTKNAWLGITGAAMFFLLVIPLLTTLSYGQAAFRVIPSVGVPGIVIAFQGPGSSMTLFWLAGIVAMLVYLVDVKPAVAGVQGGGFR
jgi:Protein of unknown function (DUF2516)